MYWSMYTIGHASLRNISATDFYFAKSTAANVFGQCPCGITMLCMPSIILSCLVFTHAMEQVLQHGMQCVMQRVR